MSKASIFIIVLREILPPQSEVEHSYMFISIINEILFLYTWNSSATAVAKTGRSVVFFESSQHQPNVSLYEDTATSTRKGQLIASKHQ